MPIKLALISLLHFLCIETSGVRTLHGNFPCFAVELRLVRNTGRVVLQTYVPTCMVVVVSWLSFWMKPEAMTERVMLGVTSLLTIFAQHAISVQGLPPVSYFKVGDAL